MSREKMLLFMAKQQHRNCLSLCNELALELIKIEPSDAIKSQEDIVAMYVNIQSISFQLLSLKDSVALTLQNLPSAVLREQTQENPAS